jgi:hypothetical protein
MSVCGGLTSCHGSLVSLGEGIVGWLSGAIPPAFSQWTVCLSTAISHTAPHIPRALDPVKVVMKRIAGDELSLASSPLKIFGEDGNELDYASEGNTLELDDGSETQALSSTGQPRRWVAYQTSLFQWSLLPISQVYVPLYALLDAPPAPPDPQHKPESLERSLVRISQTPTLERQQIRERIIRGGPAHSVTVRGGVPNNVPWRDHTLWLSGFWSRAEPGAGQTVHKVVPPQHVGVDSPDQGSENMQVSDED